MDGRYAASIVAVSRNVRPQGEFSAGRLRDHGRALARLDGFEPRLPHSKCGVLPLDEGGMVRRTTRACPAVRYRAQVGNAGVLIRLDDGGSRFSRVFNAMERTAGIEPASSGWKPATLPLSYARIGQKKLVESAGVEPARPEGLAALAPRCLAARPTLRAVTLVKTTSTNHRTPMRY